MIGRLVRRFLVCLVALIGTWGVAGASTFSTDISDFWWNALESGWGINVTLQNDVAFATFYVYDSGGNPVWYSTDLHSVGNLTWSGNLYQEHGPWFGGAFNPGNVKQDKVGTAQFVLTGVNSATLTYTVNGTPVIKNLTRTTWTNENYTGNYAGGYSIRASGCVPSSYNGIIENVGLISVTQNGSNVSMSVYATTLGVSCSFSGTYSQTGKLGSVSGNYSCSTGEIGNFTAFEMTPTISGFTARVQGSNQLACSWSGYFGGLKRAQ